MLRTPNSKAWEIAIDIFGVATRPCRYSQEKIWDYYLDGRPMFEWEQFRQAFILRQDQTILEFCDPCPMSVFGGLEGCKGAVEHLEVFFRAISELVPDSPWNEVPQDGTPVYPDQLRELEVQLQLLRRALHEHEWPIAQPRFRGEPVREVFNDELGRRQFFAWNGEGPPALLASNDGYLVFFSKHGLLVKPTYEDPIPHTFVKLWREERGTFGLSTAGETVGFQLARAKYPTWGFDNNPGAELVVEAIPADEALADVLDVLEVFTGLANQFDTGITLKPLPG